MISYKIIAFRMFDSLDTKKLIDIIFSRKDTEEPTEVSLNITDTVWRNDGSYYGSYDTEYRQIPQAKVVPNVSHNQSRIKALQVLSKRPGLDTVKALLMAELPPSLERTESYNVILTVTVDDLSFENLFKDMLADTIDNLLSKLSIEELTRLYQENMKLKAPHSTTINEPYYFLRKCRTFSPQGLTNSLARLVSNDPDFVVDLLYKSKVQIPSFDFFTDTIISRLSLISLAMLYLISPKKPEITNEIKLRNITLSDIESIFPDFQLTYSNEAEKLFYEEALRNDLNRLDVYPISKLIKIYNRVKILKIDITLTQPVLDNIAKRMTPEIAVDLINTFVLEDDTKPNIFHLDIMKLIFKNISNNCDSPEVKGLNMKKFILMVINLCNELMKNRINIRDRYYGYEYPVNALNLRLHLIKNAAQDLIELGASSISRQFLRRIRQAFGEMPYRSTNVSFGALFEALKTTESKDIIFIMINNALGSKFQHYHIEDISCPLMLLRNQNLTDADLNRLEILFERLENHLKDVDSKYKYFILSLVAQMIKEIEPGSVTKRRSFFEWITGKRPWAKRKIRKALLDLETRDRYIAGYEEIDKKFPFLLNYRNTKKYTVKGDPQVFPGHLPQKIYIGKKEAQVILDHLPEIMKYIESPYFDYFDILDSEDLLELMVKTKNPYTLDLLEALIHNLYINIGSDKISKNHKIEIIKLTWIISDLKDEDGIAVLKRIEKLNRKYLGFFDPRRKSLKTAIETAIQVLESY